MIKTKYLPIDTDPSIGLLRSDMIITPDNLTPRMFEGDMEYGMQRVGLFLIDYMVRKGDMLRCYTADMSSWKMIEFSQLASDFIPIVGDSLEEHLTALTEHYKASCSIDVDIPLLRSYKILGQLSPDVQWVREGDIVDVNKIFPRHSHDEEGNIIYWNEYNEEELNRKIPIYNMQGPCGHWH